MASRARRLARGWGASLIATGLGAASHAAVDGTWPPVILMLLSAALAAPVCMLLAGRVLSRVSIAAAVVASQGILHWLFAQSGHGVTAVDHTHHVTSTAAAESTPQLVVTLAPDLAHHGAGMVAAHVIAAIATYALLRHGEVASVRLLDAVSLRVLALVRVPVLPVLRTVPRRIAWTSPRALTDQLLLPVVHGFRGPPARGAAPVFA